MAGIGPAQPGDFSGALAVGLLEAGDDGGGGGAGLQRLHDLVGAPQDLPGCGAVLGADGAHDGADLAHGGRRGDVMADDIADDQDGRAGGLEEGVVPVAADLRGTGCGHVADDDLQVVRLRWGSERCRPSASSRCCRNSRALSRTSPARAAAWRAVVRSSALNGPRSPPWATVSRPTGPSRPSTGRTAKDSGANWRRRSRTGPGWIMPAATVVAPVRMSCDCPVPRARTMIASSVSAVSAVSAVSLACA